MENILCTGSRQQPIFNRGRNVRNKLKVGGALPQSLVFFCMQETPTNELSSQGAPDGDSPSPGSMAEPGLDAFPSADGFSEYWVKEERASGKQSGI